MRLTSTGWTGDKWRVWEKDEVIQYPLFEEAIVGCRGVVTHAEFVKRAGFCMMACLAAHRRDLPDRVLAGFLPMIRREAHDGRNFVRKAANWALRVIGKRSPALRRAAVAEARRIARLGSPSARWIASDALRELGK